MLANPALWLRVPHAGPFALQAETAFERPANSALLPKQASVGITFAPGRLANNALCMRWRARHRAAPLSSGPAKLASAHFGGFRPDSGYLFGNSLGRASEFEKQGRPYS